MHTQSPNENMEDTLSTSNDISKHQQKEKGNPQNILSTILFTLEYDENV
jgi:hypothetical protein